MNYTEFIHLKGELTLIILIAILLLYDLIAGQKGRKNFSIVACTLLAIHTIVNIYPDNTNIEAFGGMYLSTPMINIVKTILNIGTLIIFMQATTWLKREDTNFKQGEYYVLTLSTLLGMYFMLSAGHFIMFFIGLETASIPMAALVAFDKYKHNSAEAGAKYILSAVFSSGLLLYGLSLIYGTVGTLYFNDIPAKIVSNPLQILAFVFFFAGMAFKISLVPFHLWTADTYQGAPTNITAYLSVISKGSAAFVLMTILIKVFGNLIEQWQTTLYAITIATITIANLFAIRQQNIKRFFAYSSISQAGYIMLGIIGGTAQGMTALVYYILVYTAANLAAFGVITIIEQRTGKININDYNALYKTNPKLSVIMMLSLFSLAGIPPFAGFFSKFFIFAAAFQAGYHLLVFIALLNTVISLYYYLLIVKAMFITPNETPLKTINTDNYTKLSLIICTVGIIALGIFSIIYDKLNLFSYGI